MCHESIFSFHSLFPSLSAQNMVFQLLVYITANITSIFNDHFSYILVSSVSICSVPTAREIHAGDKQYYKD